MEAAKASAWQVRISATKVRQVLELIRGKKASEALVTLKYTPNRAARHIEKVLKSAVANAEHNKGMDMDRLVIVEAKADQGAYMTGKAWIPFYFGGDRHRFELVYKGQGRLIFAGGGVGNFTSGNLIWIIHNANEGGYR